MSRLCLVLVSALSLPSCLITDEVIATSSATPPAHIIRSAPASEVLQLQGCDSITFEVWVEDLDIERSLIVRWMLQRLMDGTSPTPLPNSQAKLVGVVPLQTTGEVARARAAFEFAPREYSQGLYALWAYVSTMKVEDQDYRNWIIDYTAGGCAR